MGIGVKISSDILDKARGYYVKNPPCVVATAEEFEAAALEVLEGRPEVALKIFGMVLKARALEAATTYMVDALYEIECRYVRVRWKIESDDWMEILTSAFEFMYKEGYLPEEDIPL